MKSEIITPSPFMKIAFNCSYRAFYNVKQTIYDIASKIDKDIYECFVCEKCDHEGDLECIIIYNKEISKLLINEVLKFYQVNEKLPDGMNLHLSIF